MTLSLKHSESDPVTMRILTLPAVSRTPKIPFSYSVCIDEFSPSPPAPSLETVAAFNHSTPTACGSTINSEMEVENIRLKEQLSEVESQLKCVLDYTVESDRRMLEYTSVFIAYIPHANSTH